MKKKIFTLLFLCWFQILVIELRFCFYLFYFQFFEETYICYHFMTMAADNTGFRLKGKEQRMERKEAFIMSFFTTCFIIFIKNRSYKLLLGKVPTFWATRTRLCWSALLWHLTYCNSCLPSFMSIQLPSLLHWTEELLERSFLGTCFVSIKYVLLFFCPLLFYGRWVWKKWKTNLD